jgi:hypothetical protein
MGYQSERWVTPHAFIWRLPRGSQARSVTAPDTHTSTTAQMASPMVSLLLLLKVLGRSHGLVYSMYVKYLRYLHIMCVSCHKYRDYLLFIS